MKNKLVITAVAFCMLFIGCSLLQTDPKAEFVASANIYTSVVESLNVLKANGKLDDTEIERINILVEQGINYLIQWRSALARGESRPDVIQAFNQMLDELIVYDRLRGGD